MISNLYKFKTEIEKDGVICCFTGPFTQDLLIGIGETLKKKMELEGASLATTMDLFSVFVEETQNIIQHSAERYPEKIVDFNQNNLALGIIIVGYENGHYYVHGGNTVKTSEVNSILSKLKLLQKMNKEELKNYYKEMRRKSPENEYNNTGLGFIEVARKVSKPIDFEFEKIDNEHSFFTFKAII